MKIKDFIFRIQNHFQDNEGKKITQSYIAKLIGVKHRTYVEYIRGTNEPQGMKNLLNMLCLLRNEDIIELIRKWEKDNHENIC